MTTKNSLSKIGNQSRFFLVKDGDAFAVYHRGPKNSNEIRVQEGSRADCIGFIVGCVLENMSTKERRQAEEQLTKITEAA